MGSATAAVASASRTVRRGGSGSAGPSRRVTRMMPVGVPRVPYRLPKGGAWVWIDIWNVMVREKTRRGREGTRETRRKKQKQKTSPPPTLPPNLQYRDRIIFLQKPVDDELANQLVATMLYLDSEDKKDIRLYINASGGDVVPCLAMYDTMRYLKSDVGTVGFGACMGMAGFLLAAGAKGKRCVLPNTRIMLHHPSGATRGQAADIDNEARELMRTRNYVNRVLARATDKDVRTVQQDFNRAKYFDAKEAVAYGIVDKILPPPRTVAQELAQAQSDAAAGKGRAVAGGPAKPL